MRLTERHIFKKTHQDYKVLDNICFLSKNLYNSTLYDIRQYYFEHKKYISYPKLNKIFIQNKNKDYYNLPTKVSQNTMKMADNNFKSFFNYIKKSLKSKIPNYLDKDGRYIATFTIQAISKKHLKNNIIKLSGFDVFIKTKIKSSDIQQVRIVPKKYHITVEVVYNKIEIDKKKDNKKYASIDLGLNNLATIAFNNNENNCFAVNGKILKSINHYYNKKKSKFQESKLLKSKRFERMSLKRENKISDYLHKSSRYIVNQLVSKDVSKLVIGYNKGWKQDINIGKVNNQNFVNVPFYKFVNMLKYKCQLVGIEVVIQEESYTSKCSFLDNEEVKKHDIYKGKRIKRGLFKASNGDIINADLNGAYNIMRKAFGDESLNAVPRVKINGIKVCSMPIS